MVGLDYYKIYDQEIREQGGGEWYREEQRKQDDHYNKTEEIAYKKSELNSGSKSSFTAAHNEYISKLLDDIP